MSKKFFTAKTGYLSLHYNEEVVLSHPEQERMILTIENFAESLLGLTLSEQPVFIKAEDRGGAIDLEFACDVSLSEARAWSELIENSLQREFERLAL